MANFKLYIILALCLILLTHCNEKYDKRIVFLGDSLTEQGAESDGYIPKLKKIIKENHKEQKYQLIGAGISGDKIHDLYLRLEKDVLAKKPDAVVIWIGINDVWQKSLWGTGTDNWKFERFYHAIIKKLKAQNIEVLLCTPTMVGESIDTTEKIDRELNSYAEIVRSVAKTNNCQLIDTRKDFIEYTFAVNKANKDSGILTTDGVHLNDKGNQLAAESMYKVLKKSVLK